MRNSSQAPPMPRPAAGAMVAGNPAQRARPAPAAAAARDMVKNSQFTPAPVKPNSARAAASTTTAKETAIHQPAEEPVVQRDVERVGMETVVGIRLPVAVDLHHPVGKVRVVMRVARFRAEANPSDSFAGASTKVSVAASQTPSRAAVLRDASEVAALEPPLSRCRTSRLRTGTSCAQRWTADWVLIKARIAITVASSVPMATRPSAID
ncbi:MAG: hypothetical protein IPI44_23955 [Sulfuritalea sp.]|nr:hypothetical protein [Sulfuritalea sp.]